MTVKDGLDAEKVVVKFLEKNGYLILRVNYRVKGGEIDIIVMDKAVIVAIEVKFRKSSVYGFASEQFSYYKRLGMTRAISQFVKNNSVKCDYARFDLVALQTTKTGRLKLTHYKGVHGLEV